MVNVLKNYSKALSEVYYKNKLRSVIQKGYSNKRSRLYAIVYLLRKFRGQIQKKSVYCMFLDLLKAFDAVDHSFLIAKCQM